MGDFFKSLRSYLSRQSMNQSPNLKADNYQHLEEIFQLAVETTKKTLKCDRVIVYDASELPKSEVIAESVDSEYASIQGTIITDPFLAEEYLEMYCYGQAVAINDVSQASISKSKLKDLEKLEIKSLLIAPISVDNKLLAFLVVHQCSKFRAWNTEAINFLTGRANAAAFALSNIIKAQKPRMIEDNGLLGRQNTFPDTLRLKKDR